jgi:hypothetical protein
MRLPVIVLVWLTLAGVSPAAEVARLVVAPEQVELRGSLDRCQALATLEQDGSHDRTQTAVWSSSDLKVAIVEGGYIVPRGNGTATITVAVGTQRGSMVVTVRGLDTPALVSFRRDVLGALSAAGCNQGACHGRATGQGSFRLSLRGCDPDADFLAITREGRGRRIDPLDASASLLVKKGLGSGQAEGCRGFVPGTLPVAVVQAWIGSGAQDDPKSPEVQRIQATPGERRLIAPEKEQQLAVRAILADNTERDVTRLSVYSSSDPEIAVVGPTGRVRFLKPGEVAILCRYLGKLHTVRVSYLDPKPGFVWQAPPEVNFIDKLVFAKLKQMELPPAELCPDNVFLRRACLDLCALQPTPEMVRAFAENNDPKKRQKLVEDLLARGDYADFWALHWLEDLHSSRNVLQMEGASAYRVWLRTHLRDNTPFDAVVRELLTASGPGHEVGPANYFRISRTPLDLAEMTGQLFLGSRLQCARCHDHPHDSWTQEEFAGLAAFFAQVKLTPQKKPNSEAVGIGAASEVTVPGKKQAFAARFPGGPVAQFAPGEDRRVALAKWLTAKENPYFSRAIVNRVWSHLFGRGIIDPVDDMRPGNPAANEALLDALARDFADHNFDIKYLLRTIMASRTYQLSSMPHEASKEDTRYFSRNYQRRMTGEQLIDTISAVTEVPEKYEGMPAGTRAIQVPDPWGISPFLQIFGRPARETQCECAPHEANIAAALHLLNSDGIQKRLQDPRNRIGRLIAQKATDREITEELFLATFCRLPTMKEFDQVDGHVAKMANSRRQAFEDILWALLNTKEFIFRP